METCIGIISYLPDNQSRLTRFIKLKELIKKCNNIFDVPIIIIAQNWDDSNINSIKIDTGKIIIYNYKNKLGITGARRMLRKYFLESKFDYLIMLDDDSVLVGNYSDGRKYLKQIEDNPDKFGIFKEQLLKLFAISKYMYSLIDFPNGEAENGDFFEDMYLIKGLTKLYPDRKFRFVRNGLNEYSNSANDPDSTWFHKQFNKHDIGDKTRSMIYSLRKA